MADNPKANAVVLLALAKVTAETRGTPSGGVARRLLEKARADPRPVAEVHLETPECDKGCYPCLLSCALDKLLAALDAPALTHEGVTYAEPMGRA